MGCAKGFMLHDLAQLIPGITVKGVDVSAYAIEQHAIEDMQPHVQVADARKLPFADKSFDAVIAVNKALAPGAKPRYDTLLRVVQALGVRLHAQAA